MTTGSSVDRIEAVDGPTRAIPAKNIRIAATVLTTAMAAIHAPTGGIEVELGTTSYCAGQAEGDGRAGADESCQPDRRDRGADPIAREDVDRVRDRGAEAHRRTDPVQAARSGSAEDENGPGRRDEERGNPAYGRLLAAERDRADHDENRVGVEDQREQRRVHPLERPEEEAGLGRIADTAHRETGRDRATRQALQSTGRSRDDEKEYGRDREAQQEQISDVDASVVRVLPEDRHRAETGSGQETEEGTHSDDAHIVNYSRPSPLYARNQVASMNNVGSPPPAPPP